MLSHPAWGEWIEIRGMRQTERAGTSHPAWGEWIEMEYGLLVPIPGDSLTPHGVSGLK